MKSRKKKRELVGGWFKPRALPHFDPPIVSFATANNIATVSQNVQAHSFYPLITFSINLRKRKKSSTKKVVTKLKKRELAICANSDAAIFSYYAYIIKKKYEHWLMINGLENAVVGYRSGFSNTSIAKEVFSEISQRNNCVAFALDVSGFFDNIPHDILKNKWAFLVNGSVYTSLPDDHYAVFKAVTKYSTVDLERLIERIYGGQSMRFRKGIRDLPRPLCTAEQFRRLVRSRKRTGVSLIKTNKNSFGIPQGTPISPILSNISMMDFDFVVNKYVTSKGGTYKRYSDDILIICSKKDEKETKDFVNSSLSQHVPGLKLKTSKEQIVTFISSGTPIKEPPLQYLGFTFDGTRILLRGGTISRQWRRLASAVRWAKSRRKKAVDGEIAGRHVLHRASILEKFTHLGRENFYSGYVRLSAKSMSSSFIKRQLRGSMKLIQKFIEKR